MSKEPDQEWIIWQYMLYYWTPIDPSRRLSDADATRIFSLRGRNLLPPVAPPMPPMDYTDQIIRKLYFTESEAIAYTGVGQRSLRAKVQAEKIGPRGALVYRRATLEKLWGKTA